MPETVQSWRAYSPCGSSISRTPGRDRDWLLKRRKKSAHLWGAAAALWGISGSVIISHAGSPRSEARGLTNLEVGIGCQGRCGTEDIGPQVVAADSTAGSLLYGKAARRGDAALDGPLLDGLGPNPYAASQRRLTPQQLYGHTQSGSHGMTYLQVLVS